MNSQQARNLVKRHASDLQYWVSNCYSQEKHLVPMALIYVHKRLSEEDWKLVCEYDGKQPFEEFARKLVESLLETFSNGVWFGECAKMIHLWINRYGISNESRKQDVEDYVKNQLTKDNFARFRSYKENKKAHFSTYISIVIRNLIIDFFRKKTPLTKVETLDGRNYTENHVAQEPGEVEKQRHLEEIGQWFFSIPTSNTRDESVSAPVSMPEKLKLSPKERLFLRAIYKDGMTVEEAGRLPGINLRKWQAHGHHKRLKARIKKLLNQMGYENIHSLLLYN